MEEALHSSSKRALDGFFVIDQQAGSEWGCSEEKISSIERIIQDSQALALLASTVLNEKDAEFSDAYLFWFGEGNAKAATRNSIKTLHYDPVNSMLKPPGSNNRVDDMRLDNLSPTGLTYMCAAGDNDICAGGMAAAAHQHGAGGLSGHSIVFCERFFQANSQQEMLRKWVDTRTLSASSGFWLLHEVQHLSAIVSDAARCIDVPDPNRSDGSGCYDPNCCSSLKDSDKIRNAQNMAFFALEVTADPERGSAPGQSCTIMKRSKNDVFFGELEDDPMAGFGYSPRDEFEALRRRQARSSSRSTEPRANSTSFRFSRGAQPTLSTSRRPSSSGFEPQQPSSLPSSAPSSSRPPVLTTVPPVLVSSFSGASFSLSYSTAPTTQDGNGVPIVPIVPVPVPVAPVPPPPVPPGGGGGNGGDNGDGNNNNNNPTSLPQSSRQSSTPTSVQPSSSGPSGTPCSSRPSKPPLSAPTGGAVVPDQDGFPQAVYDKLAAEASSGIVGVPTSTVSASTSPVTTVNAPTATASTPAVAPVACYNFDINAYGYCCPGPGNPCQKDLGKCYFNGEGVTGGSSGVVPDGARCPPPPGAEYCLGTCEV